MASGLNQVICVTHMKEDKLFCICGLIVGIVLLFYILSPYSPTCLPKSCVHEQYNRTDFLYGVQTIKRNNYLVRYTTDNGSSVSVLVFVHIQKTAGTLLERRLVNDGLMGKTCNCFAKRRCSCKTQSGNTWLVSRYSTGWLCGLHADLTELTECIDGKLNTVDHRTIKRKKLAMFNDNRNHIKIEAVEYTNVKASYGSLIDVQPSGFWKKA